MKITVGILLSLAYLSGCGFTFDPSEHCFSDQICDVLYVTAYDGWSTKPDAVANLELTVNQPEIEPQSETMSLPEINLTDTDPSSNEETSVPEDWWSAADSPDPTNLTDTAILVADSTIDEDDSTFNDETSDDADNDVETSNSPDVSIALCHEATDCSDHNPCTVDVCVPAFGCVSQTGLLVGLACDDDNACTTEDACDQSSTCTGAPIQCPAVDQCHQAGTCDPATGACSTPLFPNGTECEDGLVCTIFDTCQDGVCQSGSPLCQPDACHKTAVCQEDTGSCTQPTGSELCTEDGNVCTHDFCDLKVGCYGINVGIKPGTLGGCGVSAAAVGEDPDYDGITDQYDEDDDGDGIPDYADNAQRIWNPDQADTDGDGLGDAKDADADGDGTCDPTWPTAPYGYCGTPPPP